MYKIPPLKKHSFVDRKTILKIGVDLASWINGLNQYIHKYKVIKMLTST